MITAFGVMFLPVCLWYWRTPARLLMLILFGSVFAAAAVIAVGGYGVTPALVPTALFIGFFLLKSIFSAHYPAEAIVWRVLAPFVAVVLGAIASSFIMPRLFEGEILVWPQKLAGFFVLTPLAPNSGNYTQDMYLLANAALTVTASLYLTRSDFDARRLLDAYFASGLMAVFIAVWQFTSNTMHIWYPTDFFLSNPGWSQLSEESIGTLVRLNGPFSEPSALAGYLCGAVSAAAWVVFHGDKEILPRVLLVLGLGVILLSTSTTGYVALVILGMVLLFYTFISASPAMRKRVTAGLVAALAITAVCVVTVPTVAPGVAKEAETVIYGTLNKKQSSSYSDRTAADRDSMHEMEQSYGLGVGWGSNRSSSLGPGLCASVGIWGIAGLLLFVAVLMRHARLAHKLATEPGLRMVMHGCSAALLGTIIPAFLAGPTISSPDFYLLLALLVGTAARVRHGAGSARAALPRAVSTRPSSCAPAQTSKG
jgi:O-Antigen ligase